MKAWVLRGIQNIGYEEVKAPVPEKGWALVKVMASGICGSDIPRIYKTGAHNHPIIPGHEFSGIVESVGDESDSLYIGKRVGVFPLIPCGKCECCRNRHPEMCENYNYLGSRCDGGYAQYVKVPVRNLVNIPDEVSYECAAMLEPMAVAVHAMRQAGIFANDDNDKTALVIGLGTIGLLLTMFLLDAGVKKVLVVGNKSVQHEAAVALGISEEDYFDAGSGEEAFSKWLSQKAGSGAAYVFECVGSNDTYRQAILAAGPGGNVVTVGNPHGDMMLKKDEYWRILRKQLRISGTWNSTFLGRAGDDWDYVIQRLKTGKIRPEKLITHRFSLEELESGFEIMRDKTEAYIKIMAVF
ncbi:galactitol-1-phosphate 5-dehydrogenase [Butyrivibrio sp. AE3006]|uniref:galactitol-1-phosphate 5-dehydrogenase n=1 Tax=Butyrivibrio sp. AE3006 TaxID=1280673 RepID=UPI0003F8B06E|nr:galactitol-1-phosphate 5-dehydrogenase [Butyrivibrio sp. AE3006]